MRRCSVGWRRSGSGRGGGGGRGRRGGSRRVVNWWARLAEVGRGREGEQCDGVEGSEGINLLEAERGSGFAGVDAGGDATLLERR